MPIGNIDYDRGVIINTHERTGMDVFMYVDDPGKFLTAHSKVVPDEIAKEAGYDVEKLAKERNKKERKEKAMEMIDAELADDKDNRTETVLERNGYKVVTTGLGRHHVLDPDDNRLTNAPQSFEMAEKLLNAMAGAEKKEVSLKK
jgi:hypothetical protein